MKKNIIFLLVLITICADAQDLSFSQFYETSMLRNPALSGIYNGDIRVSAIHRNQWNTVTAPYITSGLGIEIKLLANPSKESYSTFGLQVTQDKAGDLALRKTQVLPVFTYHFPLSQSRSLYFSGSAMGELIQRRFDPSAARTDDQFVNGEYSPSNPSMQQFSNSSNLHVDASVGGVISSDFNGDSYAYLGIGLFHVTQWFRKPSVDLLRSVPAAKFAINVGLSTPLGEFDQLFGYLDYTFQAGNRQLYGGVLLERTLVDMNDDAGIKLAVGGFYRWNDAIIPAIKLQWNKWALGVSYDFTVSQLTPVSKGLGSFEFTLSFLSFTNLNNSTRNRTRCPSFGSSRIGWFSN